MSKGIKSLYSLCLKYKLDFKLSNVSVRLSHWSSLWQYVSLSNELISNEMVKTIIEDLIESNLTLDAVYELLSTLNRAGQCAHVKWRLKWDCPVFYVTSCMHIFLYLFSCSMSFVRKMSFLTFCAAIVKFSWNVVFLREMSLYHNYYDVLLHSCYHSFSKIHHYTYIFSCKNRLQ